MAERWSEDDEIYLEYFLYSTEDNLYKDAQEFLNKDIKSIYYKASSLRQKDKNVRHLKKPYSERDILYMKRMYKIQTYKEIGEVLGRDSKAIHRKIKELGLVKNKRLKDYDEEIRRLAAQGHYKSEIARRIGVKPHSLHYYLEKHSIECAKAPKDSNQKYFRDLDKLNYLDWKEKRGNIEQAKRDK